MFKRSATLFGLGVFSLTRRLVSSRSPVPAAARFYSTAEADESRKGIHMLVLTGGPCAGKSTAVTSIADRLRGLGFQVFIIAEQATVFHNSGVHFPVKGTPSMRQAWEIARMRAQMDIEKNFMDYARASGKETVILCDRGVMDSKAYASPPDWDQLCQRLRRSEVQLRDERYDAVVHMVTAALGAEPYYTGANNQARREKLEEAIEIDMRTRQAWIGHPRFHIIDNSTDFAKKINRVTDFFCDYLNAPRPVGKRRKFIVQLLAPATPADLPVPFVSCDIESTFLRGTPDIISPPQLSLDQKIDPSSSSSSSTAAFAHGPCFGAPYDYVLRRRGQAGVFTYSLAYKHRPNAAAGCASASSVESDALFRSRIEDYDAVITERPLTRREYQTLLPLRDPALRTVRRHRLCFEYNGHYFELDQPQNGNTSHALDSKSSSPTTASSDVPSSSSSSSSSPLLLFVESDLPSPMSVAELLPPFVRVEREVTREYALRKLAKKQQQHHEHHDQGGNVATGKSA